MTTPFDMTMLNDLDRFHLVMDTIDRLPQTGERLIEHGQYIEKNGQTSLRFETGNGSCEHERARSIILRKRSSPVCNWAARRGEYNPKIGRMKAARSSDRR